MSNFPFWLWGQLSYTVAVIIGTALVALRMPKREKFALRAVISCAILIATKMGADMLFIQGKPFNIMVFLNLCFSLVLYVMTSIAVVVCFECDIYVGLLCGTIGYGLQHIAHRTYMIYHFAVSEQTGFLDSAVLVAITVAVYYVAYKLLLEKNRYQNIAVDNRTQIIISTLFIIVTIYLDQFILNAANDFVVRVEILVMSIASSILGILLEISNMSSKNIELERDIAARLRAEEKEKYSYDKAVIDMLNIKAHDIKHQIFSTADKTAEAELRDAISSYENTIHTGNTALDAVLVRKSRLAEEKNIHLTCMADGEKLSFMSDIDIYSLFGNILENAIEATEKIENAEKRTISITAEQKGFFVSICAANYFVGSVKLNEGLPHTTKEDRLYHGFGLASIKLLTEKYGGDLSISVKDDMFTLDILFPV